MTALVLENLTVLPLQVRSMRMLLARLAQTLDALVSARATREVPEWRVRQVRSDINRCQAIIRVGNKSLRK